LKADAMTSKTKNSKKALWDKHEVLADYRLAYHSRQASLIGRREVLSGKAKFGIFGDGKEVAQLAMARYFQKGDWRSGYYRDQTFMFATGEHNIHEFFAQLFADNDLEREPASAGRSMNAHFATRSLDRHGKWRDLMAAYNTASDISPTGSQMPRLVGLALASKVYRKLEALHEMTQFTNKGNEVAFGTIGNASCAEGMFWESVNAIGVLKVPAVLSIWDDGYGISVPNEIQLIGDLSDMLSGFQRKGKGGSGYDLYRVAAWDYPGLLETYQKAVDTARKDHAPALIHVYDVTQPQGHSTSGSHERYKTAERLQWEEDFDGIARMREWMLNEKLATAKELDQLESEGRKLVEEIRKQAWEAYKQPILDEAREFTDMLEEIIPASQQGDALRSVIRQLNAKQNLMRADIFAALGEVSLALGKEQHPSLAMLMDWKRTHNNQQEDRISSHVYSEGAASPLHVDEVRPIYSEGSPSINGFEILQHGFDAMFKRDPRVIAFGEDLGRIGGVNQGMAGLQEKYGALRISDVGIRESSIMGQAIGLAMRGLRPIAEIQYLDYVLYALQIMSDDLATLHWRTRGGQKAPAIIRTRGHRLEGIWHSGSLMAGLIHLVRGVQVCVPRDMVRAIGMYNTLLDGDDPGIVVEVLNGYRLKETLPDNLSTVRVPLGVPEVLRDGMDITVVTYGPLCRYALEAAEGLAGLGIDIEVIDVQTLLPFDRNASILKSLKKTNQILFLDEDVPGGASAYMMQEVIERQGGYYWLDGEPKTLSAKEHRPAYGNDGNYWSKPNVETIMETLYGMMHEVDPARYPEIF
jgi:pyruvate/2-oxoglutarate/acetoin dehydrogenase E1 component/TPP-dependent pyruvate/acetoin dehydrogenase alpha subunit